MKDYTTDKAEITELHEKGFLVEVHCKDSGSWTPLSFRRGFELEEKQSYRASKVDKSPLFKEDGTVNFFIDDLVIFKQRESRHLSVFSDCEYDYESGTIGMINENDTFEVIWLQGHHTRWETVKREDIVSLFDINAKFEHPEHLGFSGTMQLLAEIVEPPKRQ